MLDRYHRQMLLPGIGETGQRKLAAARVLLLGCGALGTVIAETLVRAGVASAEHASACVSEKTHPAELIIADRDFIELTNLQRQVLFDEDDLNANLPKAEAARRKLVRINSQANITAVIEDVNHTNIERLAAGCDVIVDGLDNFDTRFLANDMAVKLGIPYIYGGAVGTTGMMMPILPRTVAGDSPWERAGVVTPCLRCLFGQAPPPGTGPTCDTVGVLGPTAMIIASLQAAETIKILTGNWTALRRGLLHIDLWSNAIQELNADAPAPSDKCPCCGKRQFDYLRGLRGDDTARLCGRNAIQLNQRPTIDGGDTPPRNMDFDALAARLRAHGEVTVNRFMLRASLNDGGKVYELTLFTDGRAIIKGTDQPAVARSLYAKYIGT